jgi:hypothetical protein
MQAKQFLAAFCLQVMVSDTPECKDDMQADLTSYEGTPQLRQPFRKYLTPLLNGSWEDIRHSALFASFIDVASVLISTLLLFIFRLFG